VRRIPRTDDPSANSRHRQRMRRDFATIAVFEPGTEPGSTRPAATADPPNHPVGGPDESVT